jgi:hypothetical protein
MPTPNELAVYERIALLEPEAAYLFTVDCALLCIELWEIWDRIEANFEANEMRRLEHAAVFGWPPETQDPT